MYILYKQSQNGNRNIDPTNYDGIYGLFGSA